MSKTHKPHIVSASAAAAFLLAALCAARAAHAAPLVVAATVPELGALVESIGGPDVSVTVFAKATEDPHFVDARPSFIRVLNNADLLVLNGLELEVGWLPVLIQNARNARVLPGAPGYLDASLAIQPINVPAVTVDRSMGDVHPMGNPHYLLDPINGLAVAALLRDRMSALRPDLQTQLAARYDSLKKEIGRRLAGTQLAELYDIEKLARLQQSDRLLSFLKSVGQEALLGGWWGQLLPRRGIDIVQDHRIWPYFARRFDLRIIADMEPKPGIAPTTKHMQEVAEIIRARRVPIVVTAAYYDPKYGDFLARETGVVVVRMANQVGARPGTANYPDMIGYNVEEIAKALDSKHSGDRGFGS